jgi:hypothetical protein
MRRRSALGVLGAVPLLGRPARVTIQGLEKNLEKNVELVRTLRESLADQVEIMFEPVNRASR